MTRRSYLLAFLILLAADAAYLAPALFTSDVRAPADVTPHWPPFTADLAAPPPPPKNELLNDWLLQFHPWRHLVADAWNAGRAPLWNDRSGCGEPLLANLQCGALSPYVGIDLVAGDQASDWRQLAQLAVAQAFCLLLAAHLGLGAAAGAVVALAYGFSSFMQIWALHPHSASASFAPGILWALLRLTASPSGLRFLVASACVACAFMAGHAESAAKAALFAAAVVVLRDVIRPPAIGRARSAALAAGAGLCGLLLAACVLVPFVDYASQSDVRALRAVYAKGLPLVQLATLVDPGWFGSALNPPTWHGAGNYPDGVVHVGVAALALAALGLLVAFVRRPELALPLTAAAAAGVMVACGPDGIRSAWAAIPGLADIRPFRLLSIVILPLAIFAGFGFEALGRAASRFGPAVRAITAAVLLAAVAATSALPWRGFIPTEPAADLHPPSRALAALHARADEGRSVELGRLLPTGMGELYGFSRLVRYDAIGLRRLSEVFAADAETLPVFPKDRQVTFAPPALLDALSVRWVLSAYPAPDALAPSQPWPVESREGVTTKLHRTGVPGPVPAILLVRGYGQTLRNGTIQVVLRGPGLECVWTLEAQGWTAEGGEPPLAVTSPAAAELVATQLAGFEPELFAIPPRLAAAAETITFRLKGPAASFRVAALESGGVGKDVTEIENQGWLRISRRNSALPFAYLASGTIARALDEAEAVRFVRAEGFDPHSKTIFESRSLGLPPADAIEPGERAVLTRPAPGRIAVDVHAARQRLLVVTEAWARGWEARIDGREAPLVPVNAIVMGCVVPPGDHRVELAYRPLSFTAGWITSIATLIALLAAAAFIRGQGQLPVRRRRPHRHAEERGRWPRSGHARWGRGGRAAAPGPFPYLFKYVPLDTTRMKQSR